MSLIQPPPPLRPYINAFRRMREEEEALALSNPHLAAALEQEKREGHRYAIIARTVALVIIAILLPFLNFHPSIIVYEIIIGVFIALGWLQLRFARVGRSGAELVLILADLLLMTLGLTVPNPWAAEPIPNAYQFQFDNFIYFFVLLAVATLAFSWRTVWSMGTITAVFWMVAVGTVDLFGREVPGMSEAISAAIPDFPIVASELDPNSVRWPLRVQEAIVFLLVAGILAIKGWRSNRLLIRQAMIASERANLSRYFPATLVDTLASTDHDIGAVRSQEIAVLFSDIVGFTHIAENETPEAVMALLRTYHALVEKVVFENGGTLDKYLGDGVMATFGTPRPGPDDARNALAAARQIIAESESLNAARKSRGEIPFKVSVGVHFGPAILGDIGPERRLEFAVVGDTVNVAARLESATRDLGSNLAVSAELVAKAGNGAESGLVMRRGVHLKGREMPVDLFTDTA